MKILFDFQTFNNQKYGGISRYYSEIINHLPPEIDIEIAIKYSDNVYLKRVKLNSEIRDLYDPKADFLKGFEFIGKGRLFSYIKKIQPHKYLDPYILNRNLSIELLHQKNFDIFHPTYYGDYFLEFIGKKPFIITIHDMIYEKYPEFFPVNDTTYAMKRKLAQNASHIIAVSENTKKDIIDCWGIEEEKISVIYHGASIINELDFKDIKISDNYLLFIGSRNGYKNFLFFIHSVAELLIKNNIDLICTGNNFSKDEEKLFKDLKIQDRVFHKSANDKEMAFLYKNAIAFIFPSFYEGFGIPILEAFANDCPVILSNASCFPEIAGNAALFFDPKSHSEIRSVINKILVSNSLREDLLLRGRIRLQSFSWEKAAAKTAKVYSTVHSCF